MLTHRSWTRAACALAIFLGGIFNLGAVAASAQNLGQPTDDVVLAVYGQINVTNAEDRAVFDMDMLKALPVTTFTTATIWTEGNNTFTGVELSTVLEAVGANGTELSAVALNDYAVSIPMSDATSGGPIIAYAMDGKPMSRRDKGPLWIIYPFDDNADFRTKVFYSRSIWQLVKIEVK